MNKTALGSVLVSVSVVYILSPDSVDFNQSTPANVVFTDVTRASGITFKHAFSPDKKYILESMSGGVAIFDFDSDGWPDLYFVNAPTVATASPRPERSRSRYPAGRRD